MASRCASTRPASSPSGLCRALHHLVHTPGAPLEEHGKCICNHTLARVAAGTSMARSPAPSLSWHMHGGCILRTTTLSSRIVWCRICFSSLFGCCATQGGECSRLVGTAAGPTRGLPRVCGQCSLWGVHWKKHLAWITSSWIPVWGRWVEGVGEVGWRLLGRWWVMFGGVVWG